MLFPRHQKWLHNQPGRTLRPYNANQKEDRQTELWFRIEQIDFMRDVLREVHSVDLAGIVCGRTHQRAYLICCGKCGRSK